MDCSPAISASLAQLSSSQSPEICRKLARLTGQATFCETPRSDDDHEDRVKSEIKTKLWKLCLSGIQVKPVARKRKEQAISPSSVPKQASVTHTDLTDSQQSCESSLGSQQSFESGTIHEDENDSVFLLELDDGTYMTATRYSLSSGFLGDQANLGRSAEEEAASQHSILGSGINGGQLWNWTAGSEEHTCR